MHINAVQVVAQQGCGVVEGFERAVVEIDAGQRTNLARKDAGDFNDAAAAQGEGSEAEGIVGVGQIHLVVHTAGTEFAARTDVHHRVLRNAGGALDHVVLAGVGADHRAVANHQQAALLRAGRGGRAAGNRDPVVDVDGALPDFQHAVAVARAADANFIQRDRAGRVMQKITVAVVRRHRSATGGANREMIRAGRRSIREQTAIIDCAGTGENSRAARRVTHVHLAKNNRRRGAGGLDDRPARDAHACARVNASHAGTAAQRGGIIDDMGQERTRRFGKIVVAGGVVVNPEQRRAVVIHDGARFAGGITGVEATAPVGRHHN